MRAARVADPTSAYYCDKYMRLRPLSCCHLWSSQDMKVIRFTKKTSTGGTRLDLRQDFPTADINEALGHLLRLLLRVSTLLGAGSDLRAEVTQLRTRTEKCTLPEDYEALSDAILALELGKSLSSLQPHDPGKVLREIIDAAIPIARALRGEGPLLSLMRLREEADNPRIELQRELHSQMERLAEGVAFLRNVSDVFKLSTLEIIQTLSRLSSDEGGVRQRLVRIRDDIERVDDVTALNGLRTALLQEANVLVEEASQRQMRLQRVRQRVEETQVQVLALESALKDANTMAMTDPLTGLGNRRSMDAAVKKLSKSPGATGVIVLDIDHFKRINDTFGHDAGDLMLRSLAQVIRAEVRGTDSGFRVGGEEFVALLPNTHVDAAVSVAERIRQSFCARTVAFGDQDLSATLSAGASHWTSKQTFSEALKRADTALYAAKNGGRNRVHAA